MWVTIVARLSTAPPEYARRQGLASSDAGGGHIRCSSLRAKRCHQDVRVDDGVEYHWSRFAIRTNRACAARLSVISQLRRCPRMSCLRARTRPRYLEQTQTSRPVETDSCPAFSG